MLNETEVLLLTSLRTSSSTHSRYEIGGSVSLAEKRYEHRRTQANSKHGFTAVIS